LNLNLSAAGAAARHFVRAGGFQHRLGRSGKPPARTKCLAAAPAADRLRFNRTPADTLSPGRRAIITASPCCSLPLLVFNAKPPPMQQPAGQDELHAEP